MTQRVKMSVLAIISLLFFVFLLSSFLIFTNPETLSVDQLLVEADKRVVSEKRIVVTGRIDINSIKINSATSELKFNLVSDKTKKKIHVLYRGDTQPGWKNNDVVYIEGHYTVERLFIGEKLVKN